MFVENIFSSIVYAKSKLAAHPGKLASLHAMECTGGEPDVE